MRTVIHYLYVSPTGEDDGYLPAVKECSTACDVRQVIAAAQLPVVNCNWLGLFKELEYVQVVAQCLGPDSQETPECADKVANASKG